MAIIRFQHSIEGELVGKLLSVIPLFSIEQPLAGEPWVFCDDCRRIDTGAVCHWKRTGVPLSAVIGIERDDSPPPKEPK